ncbi:MAG TPA: hypothetical protein VFI17_07660 [Solirubrobacterales bacterium]|nr:hypothetical protein [Solirubrobacterales bacterium]
MPRGKQFCPYENNYFPTAEFTVIDGTLIHNAQPIHRATDGVVVQKGKEKLFPTMDRAFAEADEGEVR